MADLSGISFTIKGSTEEAVNSIKALNRAVTALSKIKIADLGLKKIAGEIKTFSKAINGLDADKIKSFASALNGLKGVGNIVGKLGDDPAKYGQAFETLTTYLEQISQIDFSNLETAAQGLRDITQSASRLSSVSESTEEAAKSSTIFQRAISATGSALGFVGSSLAQVGAIGAKALLKGLVYPFKEAIKPIKGFLSGIKGITSALGRIAMYRVFRSLIKAITQGLQEGTKNLYQWSKAAGGSFAASMDSASSSMLYFKNSIAAAWSPLMNVLGPALDAIIDKVVAAINALNQLIALLSGAKGWTRATRKASEYEDAVGGAGGAAKEALKYLAPFDELNVLPDEKSGGGGGGAASEWEDAFEEMTDFESGIADFAAKIKEAIEASDWQGLGELLGGKVNELVDWLAENNVFGKAGAKVGYYINAWFSTKYWTLDTINFENIGALIAEFLNNMLANINFEYIGRGVVQWPTKLFDIIIGAVTNIKWETVGEKLGEFLRGAFDEAADWLAGKDWGDITTALLSGIVKAVRGANPEEIKNSVVSLLRNALKAVSDILGSGASWMATIEWETLGKNMMSGLWDVIKTLTDSGAGSAILDFLKATIIAACGLVNGVSDWISEQEWGTIAENMFKGLWEAVSKLPVGGIALTILKLLGAVVGAVADGLGTLLIDIADVLTNPDTWVLVKAWLADLPAKLKNAAINAINAFSDTFFSGLNSLIDKFANSDFARFLEEVFGIEIEPFEIGFHLEPVPEEELNKNYNEAKAALEAASEENPAEISYTIPPPDPNATVIMLSAFLSTDYDSFKKRLEELSENKPIQLTYDANEGIVQIIGGGEKPHIGVTASVTDFDTNENGVLRAPFQPLLASKAKAAGIDLNSDGSLKTGFEQPWMKTLVWGSGTYYKSDGSLSIGFKQPWMNTYAWASGTYKNTDGSLSTAFSQPWMKVTAKVETYTVSGSLTDALGRMKVRTNAVIEATSNAVMNAKGGVYSGGQWRNVQQFASGGLARGSQLFWAREQGPELVGTLGGHTAVMNNDQIVASVSDGVARAIASVKFHMAGLSATPHAIEDEPMNEDALYRAIVRAIADSDLGGDIELDGEKLYRSVVRRNRQNTRATGVNQLATA